MSPSRFKRWKDLSEVFAECSSGSSDNWAQTILRVAAPKVPKIRCSVAQIVRSAYGRKLPALDCQKGNLFLARPGARSCPGQGLQPLID
ncbi:hypothetical protein PABG_11407 [Paracoccidioides brasiliensis Pb03]|nr:hypothetical protein PABG_11407 [Paracoccidioides brasiliensis Pb03]